MRFAFILDPLADLKVYKDTSVAIMREAALRGHDLSIAMQGGLLLRHDKVRLVSQSFTFTQGASWYLLGEAEDTAPDYFDAVLMSKDPPFNSEYLYSTY